jgi:hypothetical protein
MVKELLPIERWKNKNLMPKIIILWGKIKIRKESHSHGTLKIWK